jgi:hypothetical protein
MAGTKKATKKPKPYSPTSVTQYPSKKAFNAEINTRAQGQLQPALNDIRARRHEELGAHDTRNTDIHSYYGYDLAARQAAQTRMQEALGGILKSVGTSGTDAATGLSAALRPAADSNAAAAAQLGVTAPGTDPQLASSLAAYSQGNQMGLAGDFGSYLARSAGDIGLTGVEERDAGQKESSLNTANLKALTKERTDAKAQLPTLRDQARSAMLQEILGNSQNKLAWRQFGLGQQQFGETVRSNRAQEKLAGKQQTLAESQFGETKRARRFDEKMARKQAKLNEGQLQLGRDELNAKIDQANTTQEETVAKDNAKRYDSATTYLQNYLAPNDQDKTPGGLDPNNANYDESAKPQFNPAAYKRRVNDGKFHEVLVNIMTTYGLDRATAYQVLRTSPIFRKKAEKFADAWNLRDYPH